MACYFNERATDKFRKFHKDVIKHCYGIAKDSGNPDMCKRDVHYVCECIGDFNPHLVYVDCTDNSYLVAAVNKSYIRIYGLATRKSCERLGGGKILINRLLYFAKIKNLHKIKILTKTGAEYFAKRGFYPTMARGNEYMMEYDIL